MLKPGIYERVINELMQEELARKVDDLKYTQKIDETEASDVLSRYVYEVVRDTLDRMPESEDIDAKVKLINHIVKLVLDETQQDELKKVAVAEKAEQLLALISDNDPMYKIGKRKAKDIVRPETSISQSSLFTGAVHEPQMYSELKKEMETADRVDMLVSFVKWSGLRLIIDELREFTARGGKLCVITTSYMGATDVKAIDELSKLENTEIRVSYDTKRTRLHAKAYVFYRDNGFTTAYIGSSNLSNVAMSTGLEWNVKITAKDMFQTLKKIEATFDSYWNTSSFEKYDFIAFLNCNPNRRFEIPFSTKETFVKFPVRT